MRYDANKVGILSDTHGDINAEVLNALQGCDLILHAGDIGDAGILRELQHNTNAAVLAVAGNNDTREKWPRSGHGELEGLAETMMIDLPGGSVAMEHGHRIWDTRNYHRRLRDRHSGVKAIVYGHTHIRVIDQTESPWVLNPGAAGRERTKGGPSCLIIDTEGADWSIHEHCFRLPARRAG